MRRVSTPIVALFLASLVTPALASPREYFDGVADYHNQRYQAAVVNLAKATGSEPSNALAHYYLANALVKCGSHDQALDEYRASLMLEPNGSVSAFCRAALNGYSKPLPSIQEAEKYRATIGGASDVRSSVSNIRKQLDRQKQSLADASKQAEQAALSRSSYDVGKVESWARGEIDNLHSPTRHWQDPTLLDDNVVKQREAVVRVNARDEAERIRREAAETGLRYKRAGEQRQKLLDESARELERQMTEKPGNSGVRLVAGGTDLYVRRYESVKMAHPNPDPKQAIVRIYGHAPQPPAQSTDEQARLSDTPVRQVTGKVLN